MDIIKQYNAIGKSYIQGQKKFFTKHVDRGTASILKLLPNIKNKKILDAGCGYGRDIIMYEKTKVKEIWGIDSSKIMIEEAKKRVKSPGRLIVSSMEKTPFKDKEFDIIIGRFSLHYLKEFDKTYKEFNRILKPKGKVILCVNHPMIDLMQRKKLEYRKKEIITVGLYNNTIALKFPSHTIDEYFSKEFFKYFYIEGFIEGNSKDVYIDTKKAPDFMTFRAVKK